LCEGLGASLTTNIFSVLVRELGQVVFTTGADALAFDYRHSEQNMLVINEVYGFLNHRHLRIGS
jgi:hypothetical protein